MYRHRVDTIAFILICFVYYILFAIPSIAVTYFALKYMGWISVSSFVLVFSAAIYMILYTFAAYWFVRAQAQERDIEDLGFR